jgi:hypothetical protein
MDRGNLRTSTEFSEPNLRIHTRREEKRMANALEETLTDAGNYVVSTASMLGKAARTLEYEKGNTMNMAQSVKRYLRSLDVPAIANDLRDLSRRYPERALIVAAITGVLFQRILKSFPAPSKTVPR